MNPVLSMKNVSVDIPIYGYGSLNFKRFLLNSKSSSPQYHRALDNINLDIREGARIALIGHNGAGKSTLLRLASGIIPHTSGLLERKFNFEPLIDRSFLVDDELSAVNAIEAYYLLKTGTLKGFSSFKKSILEFAGLEKFESYTIRTYSEGMRTRLQFSLLTAFPAQALALDETLGAGDASFIERAQLRFKDFLKQTSTLLFASHSTELLRDFCESSIVLHKGKVVFQGSIEDGLNYYSQGGY